MTKRTIASGVLGLAMVFSFAAPAQAQTIAELQALVNQLMAQIAALSGGTSTNTSYTFTQDLTVGATGGDVVSLQQFLVASGHLNMPTGVQYGYFGPLTRAAVASWQAANGVAPAVGYWGPLSRAKANSMNVGTGTTTGGTVTTGTGSTGLQGTVGDITIEGTSEYSGETVGEGQDDVEVLAFEVEADDNSDVRLTSLNIELYQQNADDSRDLDDYATEVTVWVDGKQVASLDADDFNENSDIYSKAIALNDVIVRAGDTETITLAVSAVNNIDSSDRDTDDWHIGVSSVRFVDGQGAVVTESVTLDIDDDTVGDEVERAFEFGSYAQANDASLELSLGDEDINDARTLNVDDDNHTDLEILSFVLEADGDSDIWVDEIPVVIAVSNAAAANIDESTIIVNATLFADGDQVGSEDVVVGGAVNFDDLDMTIDAGDEVEFTLEVTVQETDGALTDGDTIQATVTVGSIEAEDEAGDDVTATGTAAADTHVMYDVGINVTLVSSEESITAEDGPDNDTVTHKLVFDITAFDGTVWVDNGADATTTAVTAISAAQSGILYNYDIDGSATTSLESEIVTKTDQSGSITTTGDEWVIENGETVRVTLTVSRANATTHADSDGFHQVELVAIGWSATSIDDTTMNIYNFDLEDFDTGPIFAN